MDDNLVLSRNLVNVLFGTLPHLTLDPFNTGGVRSRIATPTSGFPLISSGCVDPSGDDLALTKPFVQVGELLGIPILDHLIVAKVATRH
jgi:hypothetical protein